jgi:hypothetical protein
LKYSAFIIISMFTLRSCNDGKLGMNYLIKENYEVIAGELNGMKGNSEYTLRVNKSDEDENMFTLENFANSYKAKAILKNDSLFIPSQQFPYYESHVTIDGKGKVSNDTLYYEYFSGGPAGQIICKCIGVLKN